MCVVIVFEASIDLGFIEFMPRPRLVNLGGLLDPIDLFIELLLSYDPMPLRALSTRIICPLGDVGF